jgi:subtilisin family serine protease
LDWDGGTVRNFNGTMATPTSMNVVNLSYTFVGQGAQAASDQVANFLKSNYQSFDLSNAVITKAAGNSSVTSNNDILSKTLANNSSIAPRLLIVGAVNGNGTTSSPVNIAYYSNTAGTDLALANRFVLANGNAPWSTYDVKINNSVIPGASSNMGTSYAAPLVAGYAAIVQQKFPGLNAANTSNIILDTARYDTLTCYPGCNTNIYGKGEASLSRALAPVGRLR